MNECCASVKSKEETQKEEKEDDDVNREGQKPFQAPRGPHFLLLVHGSIGIGCTVVASLKRMAKNHSCETKNVHLTFVEASEIVASTQKEDGLSNQWPVP